MSNSNPQSKLIDQRDAVVHELVVLKNMMNALPPTINLLLSTQLNKVLAEFAKRDTLFLKTIKDNIDDAKLAVKYMEFDLEATKRERDALLDK